MYIKWLIQYRNKGDNKIFKEFVKFWAYTGVKHPYYSKKYVMQRFRNIKTTQYVVKRMKEIDDPKVQQYKKHGYGISHGNGIVIMNLWREKDEKRI